MACSEWRDTLHTWLGRDEKALTLLEDEHVIVLQRLKDGLLLSVQLVPQPPNNAELEQWLRLGEPSLRYFQGTLALDPATGKLWLRQWAACSSTTDAVLALLEMLLNQRDTWCSMVPTHFLSRTTLLQHARPFETQSTFHASKKP